MDVMLVTEGTYPQVHGGVSTWCDQMIRGLARHRFHVVSLTATGREPAVWDLPDNVLGHTVVPIWTMSPRPRRRPSPMAKSPRPPQRSRSSTSPDGLCFSGACCQIKDNCS